MNGEDRLARHRDLFNPLHRKPSNNEQHQSLNSAKSATMAATATTKSSSSSLIKKRSAASSLAALLDPKSDDTDSSTSDTESSLENLGETTKSQAATTAPTSSSNGVPRQTQYWNAPSMRPIGKTKTASQRSISTSSRPVASTSTSTSTSTSRVVSQPTYSHKKQTTQTATASQSSNTAAYQSSNSSARNRANSPHKYTTSTSSGKGKGKERDIDPVHISDKKTAKATTRVTELDDTSSSEEEPLPVKRVEKQEKKKKKLRRASDETSIRKEESKNSIDDSRQVGIVDILPPERLRTAVPIDDFLFTPPTVQSSPPRPIPVSTNSTSSKENRGEKQRMKESSSSRQHASSKATYTDLPEVAEVQYKKESVQYKKESDHKKDDISIVKKKEKKRKKEYKYEEDLDYEESVASSTTMSDGIVSTTSSTASLRESTSKAKLHTSPMKNSYTPNTRRAMDVLAGGMKERTPAASGSGGRTPTVSRGIKSGAPVSRSVLLHPPETVKKKLRKEEYEDLPSGNSGPARSSPPPTRPSGQPQPQRRAKPAVRHDNESQYSQGLGRDRASSSSSSSHAPGSSYGHEQSRKPLADKPVRASTSKNTTVNRHAPKDGCAKGSNYIDLASSPEKQSRTGASAREGARSDGTSTEKRQRITLSSRLHAGVDTEEEDSVIVAISSTLRDNETTIIEGKRVRVPIGSQDLRREIDKVLRGQPSPVFGKTRPNNAPSSSSTARRPKAIPAAKNSKSTNAIKPLKLAKPEEGAQTRPTTPGKAKSSRRQEAEVIITSSVSPRKRPNREDSSRDDINEERKAKRRSIERSGRRADTSRYDRSESPLAVNQTQILWNEAAGINEYEEMPIESDSDDDVPVASFRETVLCPFCDRSLPQRPSRQLIYQLQKLCYREDLEIRESVMNKMALRLPPTDTALFCKRHKDESDIIPAGEAAGYPTAASVDWKSIQRRIYRDIIPDLKSIVSRRSKSSFFETVCKEWEAQGARKMNNMRNQYSTFYLELPGYYGQIGFQTILNVLTAAFVSKGVLTPFLASPMTVDVYLRRVLVPETAVRLIQVDQGCSTSKALKILEESRDYGAAVFGDMDTASSLHFKETQTERHMRAEEEEAAKSQRENLLSSQGYEAEALKMGEAIITKLRKLSA